jgi:hypothetical protein
VDDSRVVGGGDADAMMDSNIQIELPTNITAPHRRNHYNLTVGVCCIVKDAEPNLEEWLDYQLLALVHPTNQTNYRIHDLVEDV